MQELHKNETITLKDGTLIPRLGQGTWYIGDNPNKKEQEITTIKAGIKFGIKLIDTAEMYGNGKSELLIGEAIREIKRDQLYIVSKVYPQNAGKNNIFSSCEKSLNRLGVDYLDLYLLHWRGSVPLAETVACMEELIKRGKIKHWGVSNFDTDDMKELWNVPGGKNCAVNQVLYHLGSRGIEYDLVPWHEKHNIPIMSYSPIAQGGSLKKGIMQNPRVKEIANKYKITPAQLMLTFVLRNQNIIAIPKASSIEHVKENAKVLNYSLTEEDVMELSKEYPAPTHKTYLDMI